MPSLYFKVIYYITSLYSVPVLKDYHPYKQFGYVANSMLCDVCPLMSILWLSDPAR